MSERADADANRIHASRVARGWFALPHPLPILFVLVATAGFALLVAGGRVAAGDLAGLLLAMLGGQLAIGALNEIVDAELDARAKPAKPIPSGLVSVRGAWGMVGFGLALMVVAGARFGAAAFALLAAGTALGIVYDLWAKRTPWSWLPYLLALPLLPIWARTALIGFEPRLLLIYPLGAGAIAAIHLAQSLPDADRDRAAGLRNPVAFLGRQRAAVACWLLAWSGPALVVLAIVIWPGLAAARGPALAAAALDAALIGVAALATAAKPDFGAGLAFALIAAGAVALGFGWVLAAG
ncbi:MAG TPA: UbiA family prenyltransferase [Thermomicrobiales bacterium]|nr:UbiA family prenyltransferase [Thermomicrobiales bacterium]